MGAERELKMKKVDIVFNFSAVGYLTIASFVLFWGEPDLIDAVIFWLMN